MYLDFVYIIVRSNVTKSNSRMGSSCPLGQPIRTLFIVFMGIASDKIN